MNYFKLLEIKERYDLDKVALDNNYFALQRASYLDNKKDISQIDLNKAYFVLKNDLSRAEYILALKGVNISDPNMRGSLMQEELEEIWEELEKVEKTENIKELKAVLVTKQEEKDRLLKGLAKAFERKDLQEALAMTFRLKYLVNLTGRIKFKIEHADSTN